MPEKGAPTEPRVPEGSEVLLEREVKLDPMGCRELKGVPEDQDLTEQRGARGPPAVSERPAVRDSRACLEREGFQDQQDPKETRVLSEIKDLKAQLEPMVPGDFLVPWARSVLLDQTETRGKVAPRGPRAAEEPGESLVPLDSRDPPVLLASLDLQVLMDSLAPREKLESPV